MQSRDADAVIAKRADPNAKTGADTGDAKTETDPEEIAALAEAAGYEVVAELTQTRPEDPAYQFGCGKAEELAEAVAETDAAAVVFDNELTPTQTVELADLSPDGTQVIDRYRLVLDIFERGAGTERAKLQVQRAQLKWELPRIRESSDEQAMNRFTESGTRYYDVRDRIDELDRKLAEFGDTDEQSSSSSAMKSHNDAEQRRRRRREEGFEFVALAGYTNAGKSTLLHRLADDLDFEEREPDHADFDATAAIEDRLFKTLDTTTRRATIDGRRTLVTDTVGFVDELPHDLVASFHGTLSETESADCVLVIADASDPPATLRRKLETSFDLLEGAEGKVVTVLNKADLLWEDELAEREAAIAELLRDADPAVAPDPIPVSATEGDNLDAVRDRIADALPDLRRAELALPNDDDAMSLVSWLYDRASVEDVTYGDGEVCVEFAGQPSVVEKAKAEAESLKVET